ncbi:hypothetical protein [Aldersonia kunmingensis]|uniref:hypothetical protein n=1 Tax=Aldersonia kunmingensis TaxID=408066 RepID=UPI00082E7D63|nr:hypothetical protein [Aldersonia kunmingensis]
MTFHDRVVTIATWHLTTLIGTRRTTHDPAAAAAHEREIRARYGEVGLSVSRAVNSAWPQQLSLDDDSARVFVAALYPAQWHDPARRATIDRPRALDPLAAVRACARTLVLDANPWQIHTDTVVGDPPDIAAMLDDYLIACDTARTHGCDGPMIDNAVFEGADQALDTMRHERHPGREDIAAVLFHSGAATLTSRWRDPEQVRLDALRDAVGTVLDASTDNHRAKAIDDFLNSIDSAAASQIRIDQIDATIDTVLAAHASRNGANVDDIRDRFTTLIADHAPPIPGPNTAPSVPASPEERDFDFFRDVIGEDLVVDGVAYSATEYEPDGDGGVQPLGARAAQEARCDDPAYAARADIEDTLDAGITERFATEDDPDRVIVIGMDRRDWVAHEYRRDPEAVDGERYVGELTAPTASRNVDQLLSALETAPHRTTLDHDTEFAEPVHVPSQVRKRLLAFETEVDRRSDDVRHVSPQSLASAAGDDPPAFLQRNAVVALPQHHRPGRRPPPPPPLGGPTL